jgi:anti-sigma B factor antagonist
VVPKDQISGAFTLVEMNGLCQNCEVFMCVIRTQEDRGVLVLDISGRLTILDQNLRKAIYHFLKTGHRQFILRMRDVSYIDSCGLGELVTVYVSVKNYGGHVQFLSPNERVRKLLHTTRLDTIFDIVHESYSRFDESGVQA